MSLPFLRSFYGDAISQESRFAIWTKHNRLHHWCGEIDDAKRGIDIKRDTYFTVGVYPKGITKRTQDNVSGIFGVWLDIDCEKDDGTKGYFPTDQEALRWVNSTLTGLWTYIIHSGGGLHVYLMFDEPFWIESEDDRLRARKLSKAYHAYAQSKCSHTIDSVFDLSRVMRLPGTVNTRTKQVCHVVDESEVEMSFSALEELLPQVELDEALAVATLDGEVEIDDLKERIALLCESDRTFGLTWTRKRRLADRSPSGYCMSIANYMCMAGFTDGQIIVALKLWRAAQTDAGEKPESWYLNTVGKSRATVKGDVIGNQLTAALEDEDKESHLDGISAALCKKVVRIQKRVVPEFKGVKEKGSYTFFFEDGSTLVVPDTDTLMSQSKMRALAFEEAGVLIRTLKKAKWDDFLMLVLNNIEEVEEELEANRAFNILAALHAFVQKKRETNNIVDSINQYSQLTLLEHAGELWFQWDQFKRYLTASGYQMSNLNMAKLMRDLGCTSMRMRAGSDGAKLRFWSVPPMEENSDECSTEGADLDVDDGLGDQSEV